MEHYSDISSKQNTVSASALNAIKCLLTMNVLDAEPMLGELSGGIDSLAAGKAPAMMEYPHRFDQTLQDSLTVSFASSPLPKLARECSTAGHERRQIHHPLQKQSRKKQLEQL